MVTYCSAEDVRRVLAAEYSYSSTTNPSLTQVESYIEEAEDEIDQNCQHAWRETTVSDEYYDLPTYLVPYTSYSTGVQINLRRRFIKQFSTASGDKIEIWDGSNWIDWVATKTEGRNGDFWVDYKQGIIFFRYFYAYYKLKAVRMTYRYGEATVPKDIRRCCAMMVAINLLRSEDRAHNLAETGDPTRLPYDPRISTMKSEINRILNNRASFSTF